MRQLVHAVEAAYMLESLPHVEDAAFRLCFLYASSEFDPVFASGALLGAALALDSGLPFPECLSVDELIPNDEVIQEPLAWFVRRKINACPVPFAECQDAQARDFQLCLQALVEGDVSILTGEPLDATGVVARHLLLKKELSPRPGLARVHPIFRRRLLAAMEEEDTD